MDSLSNQEPYRGACIALLTQHGKERVLAPLFDRELGARLSVVRGIDTDTLGTFTREVQREGTQIEAARRKAEIAIERSGAEIGLGSEGAFVPGPFGLGSWNIEALVLVDRARGIEIVGRAGAPGRHLYASIATREELAAFATRAGFPGHGLVLRPNDERDPRFVKGIDSRAALEQAYDAAVRQSAHGTVFVESELRAHLNPTRMASIGEAGRDLVARMKCACPACGLPGFGAIAQVPGLPCRDCGAPTRQPVAEEYGCVRCEQREERPLRGAAESADPSVCDYCNP
ncbi:MAG: hypothetical protein RLY21_2654 [Planctomycetota bacterium]|jgi:hypothetical protein